MKAQKLVTLFRISLAALIVMVLLGAAGSVPAVSAAQQSYIVQATSTDLAAQLVEKHGGMVTSRLEIIRAVGATLTGAGVSQLKLEKGIVAVTLNSAVNTSDSSKPGDKEKEKEKNKGVPSADFPNVVGADVVWQGGVTGAGVTVAVIDTGLGGDLAALTKGIDNKAGRIVAWKDFVNSKNKKPVDPNGHGSHVAGIIANSQKGADGEWNGVAPGVNLIGVRVLDEQGYGTYEKVISGLQWVLENKDRYNIRVVNLSLVAPAQSAYWADPLDQAVTAVWASGMTVVVAAGNSGPDPMSITVPGNNPYVITVGAYTDNYTPNDWNDDYLAPFSSAGPTLDGFVKPDLVAPGAHMVSVLPDDSVLAKQYPANRLSEKYFTLAGTSQATGVVSGIAALVIANNPALTPDEVKMRLTGTALPWVDATSTDALYSMWQQGAGIANAPDAVSATVEGVANADMDIQADLAGVTHYEGHSYYDEASGNFRLFDPYAEWAGGYGNWDGTYASYTGAHSTWTDGFGAWSGARGAWSGARGAWSGARGAWSGARGAWSGARGAWSGGYSAWAGARGAWSGARGAWSGAITDPAFLDKYAAGEGPDAAVSKAMISFFLQDH